MCLSVALPWWLWRLYGAGVGCHRVKRHMLAGADETKLTREALKWPYGEFEIPNEVYDAFSAAGKKGKALEEDWNKVPHCSTHPKLPV